MASMNSFVVSNAHEWYGIERKFRQSIGSIRAIGLDCEWVVPENFVYKDTRDFTIKYYDDRVDDLRRSNAAQGRVALLQMATHEGMAVLVRLCLFNELPQSLKQLLEDETILKLGVNIELDVRKLFTTWGVLVTSFVDVRNVFGQNRRFLEEYDKDGLGLKRLGAFFVNSDISAEEEEKSRMIRYSNWAAKRLHRDQIEYASKDACMAIESLISFAITYVDGMPDSKHHPEFWTRLRSRLQNYIGRPCATYLLHYGKPADNEDDEEGSSNNDRGRSSCDALDTSNSDVELDFAGWQKTKDFKSVEKQTGAVRATLFYTHDTYGNQGAPLAAIDSAFLTAMHEAGDKKATLRFKVKENVKHEPRAHEVKVSLRRVTP